MTRTAQEVRELANRVEHDGNEWHCAATLHAFADWLEAQEIARPVAWMCTRRLDGDKAVFDEPCIAVNPAYPQAHPHHDWRPLYEATISRNTTDHQRPTKDTE